MTKNKKTELKKKKNTKVRVFCGVPDPFGRSVVVGSFNVRTVVGIIIEFETFAEFNSI